MLIDAHQHVWDPARGDYDWLDPVSPLARPFAPADYAAAMDGQGIDASIYVQAAPTTAETDYLLALARSNSTAVAGVVGWIDLAQPDAPAQIAARARDPLFVGVRPMLQDLAERDWILSVALAPALEAIAAHGLVFDALVHADQLTIVEALARRYPALTIVLDHAGKPPLGGAMDDWRRVIAQLSALPNLACKLSGLVTELPENAPLAELDSCIDLLIHRFAPDRLIWGSDWPVVTLATPPAAWLDRCRDRIAANAPHTADAIFGGNARRIYRLSATSPTTEE